MGITKQYLRFVASAKFGVIGSASGNIQFIKFKNSVSRYALVTACEDIFLWDVKTGNKVNSFLGEKHEALIVRPSPDREHIAVGYADGAIRLFSLFTAETSITFHGHKSAVTSLKFNENGMLLASGSKDTEIVVWDIVSQAGLFRLRGHKGVITQLHFMKNRNLLLSSSKDTFIKFWDLDTQHCFKTLTGHRSEVWDFVVLNDDTRLFTGSGDSEIRVWNLVYLDEEGTASKKPKMDSNADGEDDEDNIINCVKAGSFMRKDNDRVVGLYVDSKSRLLCCHGNNAMVEVFLIKDKMEIEKLTQKRTKKLKKEAESNGGEIVDTNPVITLSDEIKRLIVIKNKGKVKKCDLIIEDETAKFLCLLHNNSVEMSSFEMNEEKKELKTLTHISLPGHRTDVRTLAFSSDNLAILSASSESVKIWNRVSQQCIRTMPCDYALCCAFVPGDRHCVVGCKSGKIQLFDIASGDMLEEIDAHQGAVWSLCLTHDQRGFVSGSADKEVKFWDFELVNDDEYSKTCKRLTAIYSRTLQVPEEVLCVKTSSNGKLLAVSLLDSTVKVFFVDTLKFFLSLYGHKLPVLSLDMSSDSTIIVTGSADKNIKIWGLDFGDCHKSIFAHDDSIMGVQFIPNTHLFFTAGKDNTIKQWDADNFQKILSFNGHHDSVWAITVSPDGKHMASSSHDRSLRLWEKSDEPLILEEEQQLEREAQDEASIAMDSTVIAGDINPETGLAGKKTIETIKSAEKLMEGIDIYKEEVLKLQEHAAECKQRGKEIPKPDVHLLMVAYKQTDPQKFMLEILKKIKPSELEETVLVLPFSYVIDFLKILKIFLNHSWEVELSLKCLLLLFRVNYGQISMTSSLLPILDDLKDTAVMRVQEMKDVIGFNLAGLQFMQREVESREDVMLFADATLNLKKKKRKNKKKSHAILTVS